MSIAITAVVADLRRDHQNMGLLLDMIEREADCLYAGNSPDFEVLHDVMYYMTVYPDVVHHPREDRLYGEMRRVRPDLTPGFQRIGLDHQHIERAGREVRDMLAAVNAGTILDRKELVTDMLRYVNGLRSHMQWEELDLFRRALIMSRDGHTHFDIDRPGDPPDPLFGAAVTREFERLHREIRRVAKEKLAPAS